MMQLDRLTLGRMAKELGFVRDTLEKVCRLADVLKFMESDEFLSKGIALKGGTAINLTIFDLPRLSVDIDLDYCRSIDREEMLADREIITDKISKYMNANGYTLSPKSKNYQALEFFVCEYVNVRCSTVLSEQNAHRRNSSLIMWGMSLSNRLNEI